MTTPRSRAANVSVLSILLLAIASPAGADPLPICPLEPNEWLCDPNPQVPVPPELGPCDANCQLEQYYLPGQGDQFAAPATWLVFCLAVVLTLSAPVPIVTVGDSPGTCPAGWQYPENLDPVPLTPATDLVEAHHNLLLEVVTGRCPVTTYATVYGQGAQPSTHHVPCAYPV